MTSPADVHAAGAPAGHPPVFFKSKGVTGGAGGHGAERADGRQVVGVEATRQPVRQPDQEPFLGIRQDAPMFTDVAAVRPLSYLGQCGHLPASTLKGADGSESGSG